MKTITGLDEKLAHFDDEAPEQIKAGLPTYRKTFINALVSTQAKDGEEALSAYATAMKVRAATGGRVFLEDADFKFLEARVNANGIGLLAQYHAQVLLKLKAAEEAKETPR